MDQTKKKILDLFKEKGSELSTRDIASYVYENYNNKDKRIVAQLHRKLLHHINSLIKDNLIRVSRHGEKGHKFFELALSDNEEIISAKYKKKLTISKPTIPTMPIEGYEQRGIVKKFDPANWIDRINSLIILCDKIKDIKKLEETIEKAFLVVNDTICLDNFDLLIDEDLYGFLEKLNKNCNDYNKKVNCIINLSVNKTKFTNLLEKVFQNNLNKIIFTYNLDNEDLQERFALLSSILQIYMKYRKIIDIKNKRILKAPTFVGKAGPYSFSEKEWLEKKDGICFACSQSSLIVDFEKFYSLYGLDIDKFSQMMFNISKSFLSANSIQRRKSQDYFKEIISLNKPNEKEFLELSRNYIRFWNFDLSPNQELVLNMISEAKKKIQEFSRAEETIYKSCGMPARFKVVISCFFSNLEGNLSSPKYKKIEIKGLENIYSPKIKKEIIGREAVSNLFDGGNDVTFHRIGDASSEDIIREFSVIINMYKLPYFSYNFENIQTNIKLNSFME